MEAASREDRGSPFAAGQKERDSLPQLKNQSYPESHHLTKETLCERVCVSRKDESPRLVEAEWSGTKQISCVSYASRAVVPGA